MAQHLTSMSNIHYEDRVGTEVFPSFYNNNNNSHATNGVDNNNESLTRLSTTTPDNNNNKINNEHELDTIKHTPNHSHHSQQEEEDETHNNNNNNNSYHQDNELDDDGFGQFYEAETLAAAARAMVNTSNEKSTNSNTNSNSVPTIQGNTFDMTLVEQVSSLATTSVNSFRPATQVSTDNSSHSFYNFDEPFMSTLTTADNTLLLSKIDNNTAQILHHHHHHHHHHHNNGGVLHFSKAASSSISSNSYNYSNNNNTGTFGRFTETVSTNYTSLSGTFDALYTISNNNNNRIHAGVINGNVDIGGDGISSSSSNNNKNDNSGIVLSQKELSNASNNNLPRLGWTFNTPANTTRENIEEEDIEKSLVKNGGNDEKSCSQSISVPICANSFTRSFSVTAVSNVEEEDIENAELHKAFAAAAQSNHIFNNNNAESVGNASNNNNNNNSGIGVALDGTMFGDTFGTNVETIYSATSCSSTGRLQEMFERTRVLDNNNNNSNNNKSASQKNSESTEDVSEMLDTTQAPDATITEDIHTKASRGKSNGQNQESWQLNNNNNNNNNLKSSELSPLSVPLGPISLLKPTIDPIENRFMSFVTAMSMIESNDSPSSGTAINETRSPPLPLLPFPKHKNNNNNNNRNSYGLEDTNAGSSRSNNNYINNIPGSFASDSLPKLSHTATLNGGLELPLLNPSHREYGGSKEEAGIPNETLRENEKSFELEEEVRKESEEYIKKKDEKEEDKKFVTNDCVDSVNMVNNSSISPSVGMENNDEDSSNSKEEDNNNNNNNNNEDNDDDFGDFVEFPSPQQQSPIPTLETNLLPSTTLLKNTSPNLNNFQDQRGKTKEEKEKNINTITTTTTTTTTSLPVTNSTDNVSNSKILGSLRAVRFSESDPEIIEPPPTQVIESYPEEYIIGEPDVKNEYNESENEEEDEDEGWDDFTEATFTTQQPQVKSIVEVSSPSKSEERNFIFENEIAISQMYQCLNDLIACIVVDTSSKVIDNYTNINTNENDDENNNDNNNNNNSIESKIIPQPHSRTELLFAVMNSLSFKRRDTCKDMSESFLGVAGSLLTCGNLSNSQTLLRTISSLGEGGFWSNENIQQQQQEEVIIKNSINFVDPVAVMQISDHRPLRHRENLASVLQQASQIQHRVIPVEEVISKVKALSDVMEKINKEDEVKVEVDEKELNNNNNNNSTWRIRPTLSTPLIGGGVSPAPSLRLPF